MSTCKYIQNYSFFKRTHIHISWSDFFIHRSTYAFIHYLPESTAAKSTLWISYTLIRQIFFKKNKGHMHRVFQTSKPKRCFVEKYWMAKFIVSMQIYLNFSYFNLLILPVFFKYLFLQRISNFKYVCLYSFKFRTYKKATIDSEWLI